MKLWKNAKFYTMQKKGEYCNQVITREGIILATGSDCDEYVPTEVIDLNGKFVFPGFVDAHIHLIGYGRMLFNKNLQQEKDKTIVMNKLRSWFNNEPLFVEGYQNVNLTKKELDAISLDFPIMLRHNDYHSFTVNSKVLSIAKIAHDTGILIEEAANEVLNLWSNVDKNALEKMTEAAINKLHSCGITSVHTDDLAYFNSYEEAIDILNKVVVKHPLRINTLLHHSILKAYFNYYPINKYLNPIQVKIFYDGTLSSQSALIKENYRNTNNNGIRVNNTKELIETIKFVRANNMSLAIHVIGDLAMEEVIELLKKYPTNNLPDRIVHASLTNEESIKELTKLNVSLDIQPIFLKDDLPLIKRIVAHNPLVHPFKLYNKNNIIINGSSDAPVCDPNPLLGIYYLSSVNRYDAIKSYTANPNRTINDNMNGLIRDGSKADFTVFEKDILKIKRKELKTDLVYATIIDGNFVYQKRS